MKLRLSNGLEAFLISDPKADKSAAALTVRVGSWDDPKEYQVSRTSLNTCSS